MECTRKVTDNIYWVGGNDRRLSLFENLFPIPRGVSYNSYLIIDEKITLMDTVDFSVTRQFLENIYTILNGKQIDYLVLQHMEPDHCANVEELSRRFPQMKIVANAKTIQMVNQFFDIDLESRTLFVDEYQELNLGEHTLQFIMAPLVHWPEVMVTYEKKDKILFTADGFGTFGSLNGNIFNDEIDFQQDWLKDARRYYTNIVGKYGAPVQALLKKAQSLDIRFLCPLHGPVWRSNLDYILGKYDKWSRYEPEEQAVLIVYGSIYGNTENAANALAFHLAKKGIHNIAMYDVSNTHVSILIAEAFRCSHIILASPTYNGGIYPVMESFLLDMKALNLQNRIFGIIDNGTWAVTAGRQMKQILSEMKQNTLLEKQITIKSSMKESQVSDLEELANQIKESLKIDTP